MFTAYYGHSHSAPYRRSVVQLNVTGPRTASRQDDAAASNSCHFNTVLPLSHSRRDTRGAAFSVQIYRKIFAVTALSSLPPLQTCQHIYNIAI